MKEEFRERGRGGLARADHSGEVADGGEGQSFLTHPLPLLADRAEDRLWLVRVREAKRAQPLARLDELLDLLANLLDLVTGESSRVAGVEDARQPVYHCFADIGIGRVRHCLHPRSIAPSTSSVAPSLLAANV